MGFFKLGLVGLWIGALVGFATRPAIPLVGQPPVDVSLRLLFDSRVVEFDVIDYVPNLKLHIVLCAVIGVLGGLAMALVVSLLSKRRY